MVLMGMDAVMKRSIRFHVEKTWDILVHAIHEIHSHDASGHTPFSFNSLQMAGVGCHCHHPRDQCCFPLFSSVVPLVSEVFSLEVLDLTAEGLMKFAAGVSQVTPLSLVVSYPTQAMVA
ncbi:hypothetical protein VitviT2T_024429 [Vitis vinifera]|uniref:Uncharacterized protein n=1 Tax=Vitis vinifera TaxID=29760 RepID=A0ABY9DFM4_VITVI|nr:hypothetical protein VitviT2T_024429 [Vitis vinifera]